MSFVKVSSQEENWSVCIPCKDNAIEVEILTQEYVFILATEFSLRRLAQDFCVLSPVKKSLFGNVKHSRMPFVKIYCVRVFPELRIVGWLLLQLEKYHVWWKVSYIQFSCDEPMLRMISIPCASCYNLHSRNPRGGFDSESCCPYFTGFHSIYGHNGRSLKRLSRPWRRSMDGTAKLCSIIRKISNQSASR